MSKLSGKCLCEKIAYEIDGELGPIFNCHCSKCRRWHGAAFRTRATIHRTQFRWLKGEEQLACFPSSDNVTKHFCSTCGSPLISTYLDRPEILGIPIGPLEGEINAQPQGHIFVDSKADWHEITDNQPQHPLWPGSEAKVRETHGNES